MQTKPLSPVASKQQSQLKKPVTQTPVKRTPIKTQPVKLPQPGIPQSGKAPAKMPTPNITTSTKPPARLPNPMQDNGVISLDPREWNGGFNKAQDAFMQQHANVNQGALDPMQQMQQFQQLQHMQQQFAQQPQMPQQNILPRQSAMQNIMMMRKLRQTQGNNFRFANPGMPAQPQDVNPYMQRIMQMMQLGGRANGRLY